MVIILGAIIGGVCVVLCLAGSGVGYWLYRRKRDNETDEEVYQLAELKIAKKETPKSSHKGVKPVGIDPQKLSKFEKIGQGAMGVVYKAEYRGGDKARDVAIKQMPIDLDDYDSLRQLANEATLMEELHHPNIVQLLGYYQEQMNFNIVMEYVSGGELTKVLYDTEKAFPWYPTRWDIAHDIASAVHYLHTNDVIQIIHRDLKSPNVLIYYQGARMRAKVADVGIAKVISEKETATMTKGIGTPLWMAPEVVKAQGEGKKITYDEKVDIYSYGIILSELINRKEPFSEIENRFEVVPFVLRGGRPEIKEKAPASFIALMEQCWAQRASDRPEMEVVLDTLDQIKQEVKSFEC
ncbi:MAG: protein kinase [Candidatus Lokiarchaeota archaeon]|nr:protein kinase [Candidatus Lokiarchaeota archaeon]